MIDRIKIGSSSYMPQIMLGSYQIDNKQTLSAMLSTSVRNGILGFDTSPSYGNLRQFGWVLHQVLQENAVSRKQVFLASKIDGWQMCRTNGAVEKYAQNIMDELRVDYLDLLLVHWPFEKYLFNTWQCLESLFINGMVKSIGLCNVNPRVYNAFMNQGIRIKPHVIQNEISPLYSASQQVAYFQEQDICLQAYSPLARMLPSIKNSDILINLSKKYQKTIAQIIMRWHTQRGVVPVFTSSNPERIVANVDIFDFTLSLQDMESITAMNQDYKIFPESFGCPGF